MNGSSASSGKLNPVSGGTDSAFASHVLFDLDGTLSDSEPGILAGLRHALATVELPVPSDDVLRKAIGPPWEQGLAEIGVPDRLVGDLIAAFRAVYDDNGVYETSVFDGVVAMLDAMAARGCTLSVATSKPQHTANRALGHLGLASRFSVVGGAAYGAGRCTKADVIAYVLGKLGITAGPGVVMVGDRHYDIEGAAAHGIAAIGAAWGYGTRAELISAGAWRVASSPADVVALVAGP